MSLKIISTKEEVENFLIDLKTILLDKDFDVQRDLDIIQKKKSELSTDLYTTFNTLLALSFDLKDVANELLLLELNDYIETFIDDKGNHLPHFFTFGKVIKKHEIYIKVKIRDRIHNKVFCVSFHFARYPLSQFRPYK